jgi:hypothetical protein
VLRKFAAVSSHGSKGFQLLNRELAIKPHVIGALFHGLPIHPSSNTLKRSLILQSVTRLYCGGFVRVCQVHTSRLAACNIFELATANGVVRSCKPPEQRYPRGSKQEPCFHLVPPEGIEPSK